MKTIKKTQKPRTKVGGKSDADRHNCCSLSYTTVALQRLLSSHADTDMMICAHTCLRRRYSPRAQFPLEMRRTVGPWRCQSSRARKQV